MLWRSRCMAHLCIRWGMQPLPDIGLSNGTRHAGANVFKVGAAWERGNDGPYSVKV